MKSSAFVVLLLFIQPAFAYEASTRGSIEMALDAAIGRGDDRSACRHAINLGSYLNASNKLLVADMKKIGRICATVR